MLISNSAPPDFSQLTKKELHLIFDVDGVVRHHTEMPIDERVLKLIKKLAAHPHIHVTFISGTPAAQREGLQSWRKSNSTLDTSIGKQFEDELKVGKITILGALGGQKLNTEFIKEVLEEYDLETIFEIGKLLIHAFMMEVAKEGSQKQIQASKAVQGQLENLKLKNHSQLPDETPEEFQELIESIRENIDPHFRLISYGAFIESHTAHPAWHSHHSIQFLKQALNEYPCKLSNLNSDEKLIGHGLAYRKDQGFNFLMISKTNKGKALKKYLNENPARKNDFVITFGDTQVDYPMHELADLSFHLGKENIWKQHDLKHCYLVVNNEGKDEQHVEGTLYLLNLLSDLFQV